jgi:Flp pilus assembly protein CpaB
LVTRTPARGARPAAVSASTVFAIALAIVAGLIFAWLFKMVLLDKPKVAPPKDDSVEMTVAAANIYQSMEVRPIQVKKLKLPRAEYDNMVKRAGRTPLIGNQPVGRVTKRMVRAETPFYEEDLYELTYPEPVDKFIRPGYRSVVVTVPAKEAMVQVNNYVDVYCTMSNDQLGPGGNGTAEIAKAAKVVARFGTTRPGAQPPGGPDAPRQYTLEVTPYRLAMIELAKTVGGKFSLGVVPAVSEGDSVVAPVGNDLTDPREQSAEHVSGDDLAALFNIQSKPEKPGPWVIEKYVGIKEEGKTSYPDYVPPSKTVPNGGGSPAASGGKPSAQNGVRPAANTTFAMNTPRSQARFVNTSGNSMAGFKAPSDPEKQQGCATCGKK